MTCACRVFPRGNQPALGALKSDPAAIAGGAVLLAATILGLLGSNQVVALGSIAAMLGGIVSLGSNVSTLRQTEAAIGDAEKLRSSLINEIAPREVRDSPLKLV